MTAPLPALSTRQLRAFLVLAELRHFTRAAQACHLSQPAFSALIRTLEDTLGTRLFDRGTRSVQLTPEGAVFEPAARQWLDDLAAAVGDLHDHAGRRKGRVHVAALPSLAAGWLPGIFRRFREAWPGIELRLTDALSDACIEQVQSGRADFALASSGAGPAARALQAEVLCEDSFHLVCAQGHPLAQSAKAPTLRKLADYPFVHLARNSSVRQALDAALHPLQMDTVLEVEHLATVAGMVEAGLGISVVPTLTLFHFERATLATRPLRIPGLRRRVYVLRRRDAPLSVAAQTLHDLVVAELRSQVPLLEKSK